MALHGDINVNGVTIGTWAAQRLTDEIEPLNEYECIAIDLRPGAGRRQVTWTLTHYYSDGAFALAAHIIKDAHALLGGRELP
jgi:hypothetical protein